jgi:hypothetical protein
MRMTLTIDQLVATRLAREEKVRTLENLVLQQEASIAALGDSPVVDALEALIKKEKAEIARLLTQ